MGRTEALVPFDSSTAPEDLSKILAEVELETSDTPSATVTVPPNAEIGPLTVAAFPRVTAEVFVSLPTLNETTELPRLKFAVLTAEPKANP
jgi:hypothetical protein